MGFLDKKFLQEMQAFYGILHMHVVPTGLVVVVVRSSAKCFNIAMYYKIKEFTPKERKKRMQFVPKADFVQLINR